jgi:hypothetical protein
MYECVNWINKKNDQIELSHKLVLLCLKEYTRRNSTFHSKLGNAGVEATQRTLSKPFSGTLHELHDLWALTTLTG